MAIASERRIASAPARRQGSARCTRRLTSPLTATGAPPQTVVRQLLMQLLRSATTGFRNTKFLTTPDSLICDNYGTHKDPTVVHWLARHPAFTCISPHRRLVAKSG
jgi:hypothetical protein